MVKDTPDREMFNEMIVEIFYNFLCYVDVCNAVVSSVEHGSWNWDEITAIGILSLLTKTGYFNKDRVPSKQKTIHHYLLNWQDHYFTSIEIISKTDGVGVTSNFMNVESNFAQ